MDNDTHIKAEFDRSGWVTLARWHRYECGRKNCMKNQKVLDQRAYALLLKYILRSIDESIKDIVQLQHHKDFNKMDLMRS